MEEISLIEFLKTEIAFFRELLSSFVAEEMAYKDARYEQLMCIFVTQKRLLEELKRSHPSQFKAFNKKDDLDSSLLNTLKEQLDALVIKVKNQLERNSYLKNLGPKLEPQPEVKKQTMTDTMEDEC